MQIQYQVKQKQSTQNQQHIKDSKYKIQQIEESTLTPFLLGQISNNLKYIIIGQGQLKKIWNYKANVVKKYIQFDRIPLSCSFTIDSQILYATASEKIYQFHANSQFKKLCKLNIHSNYITNIYYIRNSIILTSSWDQTIIKTNVIKKQQLLKVLGHNNIVSALDYNKINNIIAVESYDKYIQLWNGSDGSLILQKLIKNFIQQILFITKNNQLMSLDNNFILLIWNINYESKQLEQIKEISDFGFNISLALSSQYIIATGHKSIKVYTFSAELVRQFNHKDDDFIKFYFNLGFFNTIQHDSLEVVLILGGYKVLSKLETNFIE